MLNQRSIPCSVETLGHWGRPDSNLITHLPHRTESAIPVRHASPWDSERCHGYQLPIRHHCPPSQHLRSAYTPHYYYVLHFHFPQLAKMVVLLAGGWAPCIKSKSHTLSRLLAGPSHCGIRGWPRNNIHTIAISSVNVCKL